MEWPETLKLGKNEGGMALPKLKEYYHATQITPTVCWCNGFYEAKWKNLEQFVERMKIQSLIWDREEAKELFKEMDKITQLTLKVWYDLIRRYKLETNSRLLRWVATISDICN